MKERFIELLNTKGECWINYLLGATYHYSLIDGTIAEDGGKFYNYKGEMSFDDVIGMMDDLGSFVGVASITENDIREF